MQALTNFMNWTIRVIGAATGVVLILAAAAIAIFGFTSFGSRVVTQQVAEILSNRDRRIVVREPGTLLSGGLRAAEITVSDTRGVFAQINGLSINWNPLALVRGSFDAQEVSIGSITVIRKPVRTIPSSRRGGEDEGFQLPIKIDVDKIAVSHINLGEQLAGRAYTLTADGNLKADQNGGSGTINVGRLDVPDARLSADMAFMPDRNQLRLKAELNEPKGGMLATLLSLPGDPAVSLAVDGDGPISDWHGRLKAALDGQQRASIEGRHSLTPDGLHHLDLQGGGDLGTLLPPAFRPLFSGQTNIDVAATFDNKGKIDIQTGNIATGSVVIAASGTLDRTGNNSLNANVLGTSGPVDFRWPLAEGEARFMITGLNLALTGDAQTARLNASASLDAATLPRATIGNVKLTAKSDAFNLTQRSGAVQLRLVAGDAAFTNPDINRALKAPLTLVAPIQIAPEGIGFNGTTFESGNANGTVNGTYNLADDTLTGNTKLVVQPAALPPAIARRFDTPIAVETQVSGTIPSKISLSNLVIKSGTIETAGTVTLDGDSLAATLSGRLPDLRKLLDNAEGEASYAIDASGPITAPVIKANFSAATLQTGGRTISGLDVDIFGNADPGSPRATVDGKGAIDSQPVAINANVQSRGGAISIPSLVADVANNRLQGSLQFSPSFEPTGTLDFDFPDISLLAMFGGQKAEGDLKGTLNVTNDGGKIGLKVTAAGNRIQRDALTVIRPRIDVTVTDLRALAANGFVSADEISSGTAKLAAPMLTFVQQENRTNFDLKAAYDNNPLLAAGNVETSGGSTTIRLDRFSGKPRNIPVELSQPAEIAIGGGKATLNNIAIKTGNGSVTVRGSAGETLDIAADIKDLPANLANSFASNLNAEGAISGTGIVKGTPAAPVADFKLDWKNAEFAQTKRAGLAPFGIAATGKYADNNLDFDAALDGADELALKARGNIVVAGTGGRSMKIDADVVNLPAKMANGFVPDLAAEGAISGKVTASGALAAPAVDFDLDWKDAATSQTKRAGLAPLGLSASGKFADKRLAFDANLTGAARMSLRADGNVVIAGTEVQSLQVNADLNNVPASVANSFVPGLAAEGTISGTAKASGTPVAPAVDFDVNWKDAATGQTKSAGLKSLSLKTTGRFADNKLDFNATLADAANLNLKADGNVTIAGTAVQSLQVNATLANVPVSIANSFVPGLAAEGTLSGTAKAAGTLPAPAVDFDLNWKDAATSQTKSAGVKSLGLSATGRFADNRLSFDANANAAGGVAAKASGNAVVAGTTVQSLDIDADLSNVPASVANGFVPGLAASGTVSGTAKASGTPSSPEVDFTLDWKDLATSQTRGAKLSSLDLTASGKFADNKLDFNANASGADGASLTATGNVAIAGKTVESLKVDAAIANLPAGIANNFVPGLAAEGILSGTVTASGSLASPTADFKIDWKNAATSQTRRAGLSQLALNAAGRLANNRLDFDADLNGAGNVTLKAGGNAVIEGTTVKNLDVKANLSNLPASVANGFVPGLAAEGRVSGTASVSGPLSAPKVDFKLDWKDAATRHTRGAGLPPFAIAASGKLADETLTIDSNLRGGSGLSMQGRGRVAITGNRALNLQVRGNVPFAMFGAQLAQQGFVAEGTANVDLRVTGTAAAPLINGTVATRGARLVDVRRNLALNNLTANISMNGEQATISRLSGNLASGGSIAASGTIGIRPNSGYPANIEIRLKRAVYVDGRLLVATVDGNLGVRGPLLSNPTLSGRLNVERASITVPDKLPTSLREVDVRHVDAPPAVRAQMRDESQQRPSRKSTISLDLRIDAPSRIFVRGRGIDAELGGRVTIKGTAATPVVSGGFTMRRGRLTILSRRLTFTDRSRITFAGDLTPALDMEATSVSGNTTLTIDVTGLATDPSITFSSSPPLPQDEVLAQLIFGQSMSRLSPVQIAQLADAVSQLAGGRSTSLFEGLRNQLGVDDLNISTDERGQTSVSVGRYLNERTYFELQQGGRAGAKAIINLDVGRGVKLRGAAGGDGAGEAGVFYEREY
jgi:translocation and assembly module TamB